VTQIATINLRRPKKQLHRLVLSKSKFHGFLSSQIETSLISILTNRIFDAVFSRFHTPYPWTSIASRPKRSDQLSSKHSSEYTFYFSATQSKVPESTFSTSTAVETEKGTQRQRLSTVHIETAIQSNESTSWSASCAKFIDWSTDLHLLYRVHLLYMRTDTTHTYMRSAHCSIHYTDKASI